MSFITIGVKGQSILQTTFSASRRADGLPKILDREIRTNHAFHFKALVHDLKLFAMCWRPEPPWLPPEQATSMGSKHATKSADAKDLVFVDVIKPSPR
ncbi:hypothetical protein ACIQC5_16165 [Paenarthrobacter sp. NPDC092416]|uniref:hypothetical protein n=1 Tax=Paenarthrobacter sp. NPDC092416 TaxID=3364386 RepID=UPI003806085D